MYEPLQWVAPCMGGAGYQVLGSDSTDITVACSNLNITLQTVAQDLDKWVDKWCSELH